MQVEEPLGLLALEVRCQQQGARRGCLNIPPKPPHPGRFGPGWGRPLNASLCSCAAPWGEAPPTHPTKTLPRAQHWCTVIDDRITQISQEHQEVLAVQRLCLTAGVNGAVGGGALSGHQAEGAAAGRVPSPDAPASPRQPVSSR